ncbi:MAG: M20/M25/M40 family metallo-hydrolase [Anaerolineae bacterium]|nr:M20/M25/M40 family metallo-hydrolase [Anaerolineae bacterium]
MNHETLWTTVNTHRDALITFTQKLVQTLSPSGHEGDVAALIQAEMERLGYDEVWVDEAGSVVGRIAGGPGPALILNGHMDHVDAGDPADWPHPPFGAEIHDGAIWGRGVADMKGALAAMIYAGGIARTLDIPLPGDLYVTAVVQEEIGGLGARHMAGTLPASHVVVGEASANHLRRGHRGRVEFHVHFSGRSVHASMPHLGANPHFAMARFVDRLGTLAMPSESAYGASTVAPTHVESEPLGANITPSALHLVLDWRNVPGESTADIVAKLERLLADSLTPGCEGTVEMTTRALETYTGYCKSYPDEFPSFTTPVEHPWLQSAQAALAVALRRDVEIDTWRFATDGGHFAEAGATVIGFGPGDDTVVHTVQEHLPLDQLVESAVGYLALAFDPRPSSA